MATYTYVPAPKPYWQEFQDYVVQTSPAVFQFAANYVNSTISCLTDPHYYTGLAVNVSTNDILPAPLSNSVPYYIIVLGANSYRLATSYDNALANIYVTLTDNGTGIQSITTAGQVYLIPLANGTIDTYSSKDHSVRKPTYTDWTGNTALPNPIQLNNVGQALIYWAVNSQDPLDNYYIEVYNAIGVLMYVLDNFNASSGGGGSVPSATPTLNFVRNPCLTFWDLCDWGRAGIPLTPPTNPFFNLSSVPGYTEIMNEWFFTKNNNNATETITKKTFSAGSILPNLPDGVNIAAPPFYAEYVCTSAGMGAETYKYIYQPYVNVNTFNGEILSGYIYLKSSSTSTVVLDFYQYFGADGSTPVEIPAAECHLTTEWNFYPFTVTLHSTSGMNVQPGNNLLFRINVPLNSTFSIDIGACQITQTTSPQPFVQLTIEEQKNTLTTTGKTGDIQMTHDLTNIPRTWIQYIDGTIGNHLSNSTRYAGVDAQSLYFFFWSTYDDFTCPIYTSAGARTVRGADANADYAANNQLALPFNSGRVPANVGVPLFKMNFVANDFSQWTIAIVGSAEDKAISGNNLFDGTPIQLVTTGTLPAPLAVSTTYYIITWALGQYQIAASLDDALNAVPIHITDSGTGIHNLVSQFNTASTQVAGAPMGEGQHAQYSTEVGKHHHTTSGITLVGGLGSGNNQFAPAVPPGSARGAGTPNTGDTPTPTPMNIIQPTMSVPFIIKL